MDVVACAPANAGPVLQSDRIASIDVLRGWAVLGILVMNIQFFAMPGAAYMNPLALGGLTLTDWSIWGVAHVLFDRKFMTIFSMLFGAGVVLMTTRNETATGRSAGRHYRRMLVLLAFGLAHAYLLWYGDVLYCYAMCGLVVNSASGWTVQDSFFRGTQFNYWASIPVSLGWVGLVMLICKHQVWTHLTGRLAAVGRMALTNYLLQTVICTTIFYGHGLGRFGRIDRPGQMGVVLAVWLFQLGVSPIWLRRFRFGPMEWLWRSLTYGRFQPMRQRSQGIMGSDRLQSP